MEYNLSIGGDHYEELKKHLYPGDGNEAVALALCGYRETNSFLKFTIYKIHVIPYSECIIRKPDLINWKTNSIIPLLIEAEKYGLSILKIHSHPTGFPNFSETDDKSDLELFSSVYGWIEHKRPHMSAIMLPSGEIFGRIIHNSLKSSPIHKIAIAGKEFKIWFNNKDISNVDEFSLRTSQAFGEQTIQILKNMKICIVGCSGTGSPTIEQLVRLGIGEIVLIDPDKVEIKNLNRIINTRRIDAEKGRYKTEVLKERIEKIGLGTIVKSLPVNFIGNKDALNEIISSDFVFGCMDSIDGRHYLNNICNFYIIPYYDLGVKLKSNGKGGIEYILSSFNYIEPGKSSLLARGVYTDMELKSANMKRNNPLEYIEQKKMNYMVDVDLNSPAVISVNMVISSLAVCDFLDRIHTFRTGNKEEYDVTRVSLHDWYIQNHKDTNVDYYSPKFMGRGDMEPFLNLQE